MNKALILMAGLLVVFALALPAYACGLHSQQSNSTEATSKP